MRASKSFRMGRLLPLHLHFYLQEHTVKKTRRKLRKVGFYLCEDCRGKGSTTKKQTHIARKRIRIFRKGLRHFCLKCNGFGYIDWIGAIKG